jgi:hypothetical protein
LGNNQQFGKLIPIVPAFVLQPRSSGEMMLQTGHPEIRSMKVMKND